MGVRAGTPPLEPYGLGGTQPGNFKQGVYTRARGSHPISFPYGLSEPLGSVRQLMAV